MKILTLFLALISYGMAQVSTIPNELFPAFRTDLNTSLQNAASITGSYSNPAWITALAYAKITGVPAFATCTGDLGGSAPGCTVAKLNGTTVPTNSAADQILTTSASATAAWITAINCVAAGGVTQYATATHSLTCHTLAGADLPNPSASSLGGVQSAAVQAGKVIDSISTLGVPNVRALVSGDIPANAANTSGNAATATALAALPTPCSAGNYPLGILANGNSTGCTAAGGALANPFTNINGALTYTASPLACLDGAIPFTQWSGIAALSGQGTRLFTVPAGWIFVDGRLETGTTFTSSGTVSTLVFSLGSAASPVAWIANFQSIPALASPWAEGGGGIGLADRSTALDVFVQANVTAGGSNLNTLTAGTMFVTACFTKGH